MIYARRRNLRGIPPIEFVKGQTSPYVVNTTAGTLTASTYLISHFLNVLLTPLFRHKITSPAPQTEALAGGRTIAKSLLRCGLTRQNGHKGLAVPAGLRIAPRHHASNARRHLCSAALSGRHTEGLSTPGEESLVLSANCERAQRLHEDGHPKPDPIRPDVGRTHRGTSQARAQDPLIERRE